MREAKDDRPRDDPILHSDRKERRAFAARARITLLNHSTPSKCNAKKEQQGSKRKKKAAEVARGAAPVVVTFFCAFFFPFGFVLFLSAGFRRARRPNWCFSFCFCF
ncbi:hypothetical protein [Pandoravirus japonicus]|uniref:Transmembrane protein n=1 Tax=Pandoravirus japonicus TaxID=2823154 RepID=A0A811BLQ5_9VIRU|nr:hypothetical protein [Pandoravirus japonicus]